jgi:hypothetical protein
MNNPSVAGLECQNIARRLALCAILIAGSLACWSLPKVAVLDADVPKGIDPAAVLPVTDTIIGELVDSKAFTVLDRANVASVLKEKEFQLGGLVADDKIAAFGKYLGADFVVVPKLQKLGDSWFVSAKMIDVSSGVIATQGSASGEGKIAVLIALASQVGKRLASGREPEVAADSGAGPGTSEADAATSGVESQAPEAAAPDALEQAAPPQGSKKAVWDDPIGDDRGPKGLYRYPTDPSFAGQCDLARVEFVAQGADIAVVLTMAKPLTVSWNPRFGFDHVAFLVYLWLPNASSSQTLLPNQNATPPSGFRWSYLLFANGMSISLFKAGSAIPPSFGFDPAKKPDVSVSVNAAERRIVFLVPAAALGGPSSRSGARAYVTTWDFDGVTKALRAMSPTAQRYVFGGGDSRKDPLIMDDTPILTLP